MGKTAYGATLKQPDSVIQLSQSQHKPGSLGSVPHDHGCIFENEYYASKYLAITIPVPAVALRLPPPDGTRGSTRGHLQTGLAGGIRKGQHAVAAAHPAVRVVGNQQIPVQVQVIGQFRQVGGGAG